MTSESPTFGPFKIHFKADPKLPEGTLRIHVSVTEFPRKDAEGMDRPSFDDMFMEIAKTVAKRGTCPRMKVGAVIAVDNKIVSTGYNGAPSDTPHCSEVGCSIEPETGRCKRTVHAEINAIIQAGKLPKEDNTVLYTTHFPCVECASIIANTNIERVVYANNLHYPDDRTLKAMEIMRASFIEVDQWLPF
jgi:dCMP deaminase